MLRQRLLAAAFGLPMLFLLLWLNWFLRMHGNAEDLSVLLVVILIAGASGFEVSRVLRHRYPQASPVSGIYAAVIVPFLAHSLLVVNQQGKGSLGICIDSLGATAAVMLLFMAIYSDVERRKWDGIRENLILLACGLYIGATTSCLLLLQQMPFHEIGVAFIFILVFGLDTAAYFGGKHFHGPPLAPKISPKKTIAGSVCGLLASVALALIFKTVSADAAASTAWWNLGAQVPFMGLLLTGLVVGIVGQIGDLSESAFKRWGGVKDSGTILPGHGGFLDRFDSLFLAAPICYLLLRYLILPR